ncbi:phage tail tape measure protein [Chryseobacterium sp.]|uniref:phage tail tape measure protein n=1 Tax=Chryseobacterium sp. TaxID=1871047 RepID=UPI002633F58B|nr:phage tail tape measure protein [Chryseobacterium sp.]
MGRNNITQTGVLIINGQQVENTFNGLRRAVTQYERQLRNLVPGTEEYIRVSNNLRQVRARYNEIRNEINGVNNETNLFKKLLGANVAADFFSEVGGKVVELGGKLKENIEQLVEIKRALVQLDSDLKGIALDRAAASVKAIADTYEKGVEEVQEAVKGLNVQTGDTNKSLDLIKKGFIAGADASGEFLSQLKEYPSMMNDARVSAEQMIAIIAQSEKMGVYDDKGIDAVKEGMLRVREGTKSTVDAMKALGINTTEVYSKIKAGTITYFDVLKMVSKKLKEIGADSRLTGTAIADVFGGPGEDAGYKYLSRLQEINLDLNKLTQSTDENVIAKNKELEANEKLNTVWTQLTGTASKLNILYSSLKSGLAGMLESLFNIKELKFSDELLEQQNRLYFLKGQLEATNTTEAQKIEIVQKLKSEMPDYFKSLSTEEKSHLNIAKAINATIASLQKKYQLQIMNEGLEESSKEYGEKFAAASNQDLKVQAKVGELVNKYHNELQKMNFQFTSNNSYEMAKQLIPVLRKIEGDAGFFSKRDYKDLISMAQILGSKNIDSQKAQQKMMQDTKARLELMKKLGLTESDLNPKFEPNGSPGATKDAETPIKKDKTLQSDLEKSKAALNSANEAKSQSDKKYIELEKNKQDEVFKIMFESKQKEIDLENKAYEDRKNSIKTENEEIKNQISKTHTEIEKLQSEAKETKSSNAKGVFADAISRLQETNDKRKGLILKNNEIEKHTLETHKFNLLRLEEKWNTKEYEIKVENISRDIEFERKTSEDSINKISSVEEAKTELSKMQFLKLSETELNNIQTLEDAKKALRENANRAYLSSQYKLIEEQSALLKKLLNDPALSPDSIKKLKSDLDELEIKKSQLIGGIKSGKENDEKKVKEEGDTQKEQIDILGFSAKDWEDTWNNLDTTAGKIKGVKMVVQALSNAFQSYSQLQQTLAEREMQKFEKDNEKKKKDLLVQLNQGYINKEQYEKGVQLLEQETAKKKAEIAYKQAKTERAIKIAEIITNTSLGIMQAYSQLGPIGGTIAAVLIGTLGAIQLGTVMNTPLPDVPAFAEGGFGKDGFEGFTGNGFGQPDESGERKARLAWLHEKEWTAPRWMTEHPVYSKKINELEYVRKNKIKGFAEGGFSGEISIEKQNLGNSPVEFSEVKLATIMGDVKDLLQYLKENGVEAFMVESVENGKKIDRTVESFKKYQNRNARR